MAALNKIASRDTEPALEYATDEDAHGAGAVDPLVNLFDLSKDPLEFARWRVELIDQLLPGLVDQVVEPGESYHRVLQAFNLLLREHDRAMSFVARYIGGVYVHRNHKGDPDAQPPLVVTEPKKQREALDQLDKEVFGPEAYAVPTKLYNYLAPTFWNHWGVREPTHPAFPIHQIVLAAQDHVLAQVLSPVTLARLLDSEMRVPAKQDVFTAAELLRRLTAAIFHETENLQTGKFTDREPAISSLRRNLQRRLLRAAGRRGPRRGRRAERLPGRRRHGAGGPRRPHQESPCRQGRIGHLQPFTPERADRQDSQGAHCPA